MPKTERSIDLTVTIRYHGVKATAYFSKFTGESIKVVRGDIAALKIPQPKTTSFELVSHGCVEFGWDMMFAKNVRRLPFTLFIWFRGVEWLMHEFELQLR